MFVYRSGSTLPGMFQIRGDKIARDVLLGACELKIDMSDPKFSLIRYKTSPLSSLIIDEANLAKQHNRAFCIQLKSLVIFIIDSIFVQVHSPIYEEVSEPIERVKEFFPSWPIIRKPVEFKQDLTNDKNNKGKTFINING